MLTKTKGVVLNYIKYTDSSVIASILTEKFGKASFIIQGIRGKRSVNKINILQALYLLELEINYKPGKNIQRIKEMKISHPFSSIPFDIKKNTISQFIAELLYKTLPEEEKDAEFFEYISSSIIYFDDLKEKISDFHIFFLIKYLQYSGFSPIFNYSEQNQIFDLRTGQFINSNLHKDILNEDESLIFSEILTSKEFLNKKINISNELRNSLLDKLLTYFYWHFEGLKTLKSVQVLKEIFK